MPRILGTDPNHVWVVNTAEHGHLTMPAIKYETDEGEEKLTYADPVGTTMLGKPHLITMAELIIRGGARTYLQMIAHGVIKIDDEPSSSPGASPRSTP